MRRTKDGGRGSAMSYQTQKKLSIAMRSLSPHCTAHWQGCHLPQLAFSKVYV